MTTTAVRTPDPDQPDENFWAARLARLPRFPDTPPDAPAPAVDEQPASEGMDMDLGAYAAQRAQLGVRDTGDFIGLARWTRPNPTNDRNEP